MPAHKQHPSTRFWSKVEKNDGCWIWLGARDSAGYGVFQIDRRARKAHRVAYELTYGTIPTGLFVCHTCDNPQCVRPDHLWLGTNTENSHDRDRKGRNNPPRGNAHHFHKHPELIPWRGGDYQRGERNTHAILTEQQVIEIRQRYRPRVVTAQLLAAEYGVSKRAIYHVVHHTTWKEKTNA